MTDLCDPGLAGLRDVVLSSLPEPDMTVIERLMRQAGRHPSAAMVFAAGLGTRMRPLTDSLPKPLIVAGGRPLIDHALAATQSCGVDRVVVNVHHLAPMIRHHLDGKDARIVISDECDRLLDTGGGIKRAMPLLGAGSGPVFTLNSDAVWLGPAPLAVLRAAWDPDRMGALLLLVPSADMIGHRGPGDFDMAADGALRRAPGLVYTGAGIILMSAVAAEEGDTFSLNRVWDRLQSAGRLFGTLYPGRLVDVGHPQSIRLADAAIADGMSAGQGGPAAEDGR
jgi:MurNAc alpha-1-phosphate uridylyltransferase